MVYNEPISKTTGLRVGHTVEHSEEGNSLKPYNKNSSTGKYVDLIDSIYSGLNRTLWRNTSNAGFTWRKKKISLTASLNFQSLDYNNSYLKGSPVNQSYVYLYPSFNINVNGFGVSYSTNIRPPSAYDLQPIIDNTNRQFLYTGNPNLKPAYSRNLSANYYKYKPTGSNYSISLQGSLVNNAVIRENSIDRAGIQTSRPVNVSGLKSGYAYISYSKPYKFNPKFRLTISPTVYANYSEGLVTYNGNRSGSKNFYSGSTLGFSFNLNDKLELNQRYSFNYSQTSYDDHKYYKNISSITHSAESEVVLRWPKHFVWENLVNYSYNPQVSPGIRKQTVRWNSGVNYLFLKEDKGQLKLSVFDLLNQNINVYRYTSDNSISDGQTTTLRRYFMLSFTYNIRTFKPAKVGGKDRSFFMF